MSDRLIRVGDDAVHGSASQYQTPHSGLWFPAGTARLRPGEPAAAGKPGTVRQFRKTRTRRGNLWSGPELVRGRGESSEPADALPQVGNTDWLGEISGRGARMRGKVLRRLAGFLILLTLMGNACTHDSSRAQPIANDKGGGGSDGGGGGY